MISSFIKFPLVFISGVFVPLSELPAFAQGIAFVSPLTYFTDLARYATGSQNYFSVIVDLAAIVGFTLIFWVFAVKIHNRTYPAEFSDNKCAAYRLLQFPTVPQLQNVIAVSAVPYLN
jgi:ABC-2 type transport system permease protein